MKTQQELMQAYWGTGGIVDMVKEYNAKHGCDVKPWECVKTPCVMYENHPGFVIKGDNKYTFALTILYDDKLKEHRPVFVGDRLYLNGDEFVVGRMALIHEDRFSWNPPTPKRTFKVEVDEEQLELLITVIRPFCTGNHGSKLFMLLNDIRDKE